MSNQQLMTVFTSFASFGSSTTQSQIDNSKFFKLCTDTKLIDKQCTRTDVDLIFTKSKNKGERKLSFDRFYHALTLIAEKKRWTVDKVVNHIVNSNGRRPSLTGATKADSVKFHDDKNTYTGVYAKGGPTNIDRNNVTLHDLLDRSEADSRGVKRQYSL